MFEVIAQNEATAVRRRMYGRLIDSTDAVSGKNITTTGVKALLSKNATVFTSNADIVIWDPTNRPGEFYVELTQAEADTIGQYRGVVPAGTGYLAAPLQASVVAFDPYADGASVSTIAAGVRTNLAVELARIDATISSRALASGATLTSGERAAVAAAILAAVIETNGATTLSVKQSLQLLAALTGGKIAGIVAGTGPQTFTVRSATDLQTIATVTGDDLGNRTNVVLTIP